jgi:WD40 repeat protein
LRVWDLKSRRDVTAECLEKSPARQFLVAADGQTVLTETSQQRWLCDPASLEPSEPLAITGRLVAVSHDGRFCATAARSSDVDTVWEIATQSVLLRAGEMRLGSDGAVFHAGGRSLVALAWPSGPKTIDLLTGQATAAKVNGDLSWDRISPDGRTSIATGRKDHKLVVTDAQSGDVLWALPELWPTIPHFVDGGRFLFVRSSKGEGALYEARTGRLRQFPDSDARLAAIATGLGMYASTSADGSVRILEAASGQLMREFDAGRRVGVEFLPDGRRLLTRAPSGTTTVWDLAAMAAPRQEGESAREQLERLWPDLTGSDAGRALAAVFAYAAAGDEAVAHLRLQLAGDSLDEAELRKLIAQLDDNQFAVRETATRRLIALGPRVLDPLDRALAGKPTVELRSRIERIARSIEGDAAALSRSRAAMVLRQIRTPAAEALLRELGESLHSL